jgi:beta-lactam-binding protein with PASTA domain
MPNVIGMNLQDAQDEIQRNGVFYSRSVDCLGAGRNQVVDSNWVVVAQDPSPGMPIGEGDAVLGVVKYGEPRVC